MVDRSSAALLIPNEVVVPIEADHRSMCRFLNEKSENYQLLLDCLKELVDDALERRHLREAFFRCMEELRLIQ